MQMEQWEFNDWEVALEHYFRLGLTDGLPVVPPTPDRLQAMLDYCRLGKASTTLQPPPATGSSKLVYRSLFQ